jgi:three-Cys-motif partner protein
MARPHDIPDDSDEKWQYTEHAAAKHEILRRYLDAWLAILGRRRKGSTFRHSQLVLVDGFAGRGRYVNGQPGSPVIMFERAVQAVEAGQAENVLIRCAEPNKTNFKHLEEVCAGLNHDRVRIAPRCQTFAEIGSALGDWVEKQSPAIPTFVMVDPYGVRGVELPLFFVGCLATTGLRCF